jgi:hypothetical protein
MPGYSAAPSNVKGKSKRYGKVYRKYTKSTKVNANDLNPFLEDSELNKSTNPFQKKKIPASSKKYQTNDETQLDDKSSPSKKEWTKKDQK